MKGKMYKLLAVSILLLLSACATPIPASSTATPKIPTITPTLLTTALPANVSVSSTAGWPIYHHSSLGVEVSYPPDWQHIDRTQAFVWFCDSPQEKAQCVGIVNADCCSTNTSADYLALIPDLPVLFTRTLTLDNRPALFVQLQRPLEEIDSVVFVVTPEGRTLTINNRRGNPTTFEQMFSTIHFFSPTNPP